jgi:hypothetical protein
MTERRAREKDKQVRFPFVSFADNFETPPERYFFWVAWKKCNRGQSKREAKN